MDITQPAQAVIALKDEVQRMSHSISIREKELEDYNLIILKDKAKMERLLEAIKMIEISLKP